MFAGAGRVLEVVVVWEVVMVLTQGCENVGQKTRQNGYFDPFPYAYENHSY
jgi:hypothetical protein